MIDAGGQYVTPGLVDLHTHVFHKVTYWGIDPDPVAAASGVTTWNDAGSAGALTLPGLREFIVDRARVRVTSFLNISNIGLVGENYECANAAYLDVDLFRRLADRNRDLVRRREGPDGHADRRRERAGAAPARPGGGRGM